MKTLVVGSGGREHAIVWALKKKAAKDLDIYCAPGNAGIAQIAQCVPIAVNDQAGLLQFARSEQIDLTFVGPEAPLAEGIVDAFRDSGLRIAGPTMAAAKLEASKVMAKDFMSRHSIPTAAYRVVSNALEAIDVLRSGEFGDTDSPVVIKADGLAAGKGVVVARSRGEAEKAVVDLTSGVLFEASAARLIIIEEALQGTEASVLVFADGEDYRVMPAARDHKRIGENDTGPNTGGMGAITDISVLDEKTLQYVRERIIEPTIEGSRKDGFPFKGVLFVGLMLSDDGPKVLEYNVRFGDPEAQAILVRLESDLAEIFMAIADNNLRNVSVGWSNESSACVVLASKGYPGRYETGVVISGLDRVRGRSMVEIFHAGTQRSAGGEFVTAGGRVLAVTATGGNLPTALDRCYDAISDITWEGMQFRRDIGKRGAGVAA
ncbi:MAG TPA: phosphoribosylamine--glycine ligase [Pyrinomonadaceae bacterium]|jgi:phosphoribosylamine--glycine ligase